MFRGLNIGLLSLVIGLFGAGPASATYQLKSYDFGNGGGQGSSANFRLDANTGAVTGNGASASFKNLAGEATTQHTNVPTAPTLTNPSSYYNRLKIVINTASNPTDTLYLIAVSPDSFVTTYYVQTDQSIGTSLSISNYQTYTAWGGASGFLILGLRASTTYEVKVKAIQGRFSESAYSPTASLATSATSLSFGVTTTLTGTPPFTSDFSGLTPGSVFSSNADTLIALSTNALLGGTVYVKSANAGLTSAIASYTLNSATADLSVVALGYGIQVISTGQASGGPITSQSPYNGATDNVGGVTTSLQSIISTSAPVTTGTATIRTKAKTDFTVPSTADYTDLLTFIASMSF